ncbi:MAG: TadE/TadG family type IV pilus assembly protein [Candidatus Solibacter sp.]
MRTLRQAKRARSGSMAIEVAMWLPIMFLLIAGTVQFGKISYTYYTLSEIVNTAATYLAVQNGVNFCPDAGDANITAALQFAVTGTSDGSGDPIVTGLTADMLAVTTQCIDPVTLTLGDCVLSGCSTPVGAQRPDFITVTLPNGYIVQPRIPYLLTDPIPLRPKATVAYGGGS